MMGAHNAVAHIQLETGAAVRARKVGALCTRGVANVQPTWRALIDVVATEAAMEPPPGVCHCQKAGHTRTVVARLTICAARMDRELDALPCVGDHHHD